MTGKDLIRWIQENGAEDLPVYKYTDIGHEELEERHIYIEDVEGKAKKCIVI